MSFGFRDDVCIPLLIFRAFLIYIKKKKTCLKVLSASTLSNFLVIVTYSCFLPLLWLQVFCSFFMRKMFQVEKQYWRVRLPYVHFVLCPSLFILSFPGVV